MRLMLAFGLVMLPAAAIAAQPAAKSQPKKLTPVSMKQQCDKLPVRHAKLWAKPELKNLGELPPGDLRLGVYRQVEGCLEPVVVRHQFSAR